MSIHYFSQKPHPLTTTTNILHQKGRGRENKRPLGQKAAMTSYLEPTTRTEANHIRTSFLERDPYPVGKHSPFLKRNGSYPLSRYHSMGYHSLGPIQYSYHYPGPIQILRLEA